MPEGDHKCGTTADRRLRELFRENSEFVWRVLQRLGVPRAEAEDAVQEVFLVVAKRLDSYEERGTLRAWLVAIARQVAHHAHRTRLRRERKERELPPLPAADDPHRLFEQNQAVELVQRFLASLEENQALVFYLTEVEGMSAPEIAASLDCNLNTVYTRLRAARQRFEAYVQRNLGGERLTR